MNIHRYLALDCRDQVCVFAIDYPMRVWDGLSSRVRCNPLPRDRWRTALSRSKKATLTSVADLGGLLRHNVRLDRIHYLPVVELKGYERKLRKRADKAKQNLKASVAGFGIVLPILIDQHNVIIAGEGILEAARDLGYSDVPTLRVEHLDANEVRLLRIALNRLGEQAEWDKIELAAEFSDIVTLDMTLDYEITGFDTIEIDNLVHGTAAVENDADDVVLEAGGVAVTRIGDLWQLGDNRVICGSSLEEEVLARLMDGELAQMVMSDSPYNVKIAGHVSGLGKNKHREFAVASGEMSEAEFIAFQSQSTTTLAAFCVDGALLYLWMDWRHEWEMLSGIRAAGLSLINMAVWIKAAPSMGSFYRSQHELCFIAKKGKAAHRNNVQLGRYGRSRSNCWFYPGVNSFGADRDELLAMHPTPKNVSMLSDAIRDATNRGELVIDGFLGSGSTLIAAERTGRKCFGVELDPLYVDTIVLRWEKATGREARLIGSGETFAEVQARRLAEPEPVDIAPRIVARERTRARV